MLPRLTLVMAYWCPHCNPPAVEAAERMSKDLGTELRILDIDKKDEELEADDIVRKHGDWCEDYLIPQLFLEYSGAEVKHVFTGFSESVSITRQRFSDMLQSDWYRSLVNAEQKG